MKQYHSFNELKRALYLWIVPFILLALLSYGLVQTGKYPNYHLGTRLLIPWFMLCWVLIYTNRFFRCVEYGNLILFSILHLVVMFDSIHNYMAQGKAGAIGTTVLWTPLIFIYIFITLKEKASLYFSLGVFLVTLIFGLLDIDRIASNYIVPLSEFYIANIIYIVILYFTRYIFKIFTELEVAKKFAYIDFLTQVANRHQIDIWLDKQAENVRKSNNPFSVIFFDLDYFKVINDRFGHKVGDSVLVELAQLVKSKLPKEALFGRWGGEEFIIIMQVEKGQAKELAEQLRATISNHDFKTAGKQTASFGVTEYQANDSVDSLLTRVDTGLYNSKKIGRDQVTLI